MTETQKRQKIIELCLQMNATGLNQGTSGNISSRHNESMLITPSGIPYEKLEPEDITKLALNNDKLEWAGNMKILPDDEMNRVIKKFKDYGRQEV